MTIRSTLKPESDSITLENIISVQGFIERYFPNREVFAAISSYILVLKPQYRLQVDAFKQKHFRLYTIGIQIRQKKCSGDKEELLCELAPSVQEYCQVRSTATF